MSDENMKHEALTRIKEVMRVLVRHGLGNSMADIGLKRWMPVGGGGYVELETTEDEAAALREALEELGGGFPIIGRGLASRVDLLPAPYSQELAKLDKGGDVVSWSDVRSIIESALARPSESLFEHIEEMPSESTRLFQVHRARLKDAVIPTDRPSVQEVAIRVLKPEILKSVENDLGVLRQAMDHVHESKVGIEEALNVDLGRLGSELDSSVREELDLTRRAQDMGRLQQMLAEFGRLRIPRVVSELATPRVLVTEHISTRPIADVAPSEGSHRIAYQLWRAFLKQFLVEGAFLRDLRWDDSEPGSRGPAGPSRAEQLGLHGSRDPTSVDRAPAGACGTGRRPCRRSLHGDGGLGERVQRISFSERGGSYRRSTLWSACWGDGPGVGGCVAPKRHSFPG